jgi:hypothetical protein
MQWGREDRGREWRDGGTEEEKGEGRREKE